MSTLSLLNLDYMDMVHCTDVVGWAFCTQHFGLKQAASKSLGIAKEILADYAYTKIGWREGALRQNK